MKKIHIISCIIAVFGLSLASCKKYLDVAPKGKIVLGQVKDYDLWLNSDKLVSISENYLNRMCDTYDNVADVQNLNNLGSIPELSTYLWFDQFVITDIRQTQPIFWGEHYSHIFLYNAVVNGIDAATGPGQETKARLKAEALLGRSFEYLYLVNLYGKMYDANTAATDLAVPIVEGTDVNQVIPDRSSVQDVYNYIIDNLKKALPALNDDNANNRFRGSKGAAYSVLARTYLYMSEYEMASKYADSALIISKTIVPDMNTYASSFIFSYPRLPKATSEIFSKRGSTYYEKAIVNLDHLNSMSRNDIRYRKYYSDVKNTNAVKVDSVKYKIRGSIQYEPGGYLGNNTTNFGTSAVEMKFIMAEAAARKGDLVTALRILNDDIRAKRYLKATYTKFQSTDKEAVLAEIFKERKFEFPFSGHRWFDMKRLDKEGKMPPVIRFAVDGVTPLAILPSNSEKYVLKIPSLVLLYNPNMKQN